MKRILTLILLTLGLTAGLTDAAHAQSYFGGNVAVYITVQLQTPIPSGGSVLCSADVSMSDGVSGLFNEETGYTTASVSASTANCSVVIPYVWLLSNQSTDQMSVSFSVTMTGATTASIARSGHTQSRR